MLSDTLSYLGLLLGGTGLLLVWYFRVEPLRFYQAGFYMFWAGARLMLRYGALVLLLMTLVIAPMDPLPAYRLVVIDGSLPEAWEAAQAILRQKLAPDVRSGLIALKGERAIWVIPPTQDTTLYTWGLSFQAAVRQEPLDAEEAAKSLKLLLSDIEPEHILQLVWIGTEKLRLPPIPGRLYFLKLHRGIRLAEYIPLDQPLSLPPAGPAKREGTTFVLIAAALLTALLLGDVILAWLLRYNLPPHELPKLLYQRVKRR